MKKVRSLILFLILCFATNIAGQPSNKEINGWVKILAVKEDHNAAKVIRVSNDILALDTSVWCQTYDRIKEAAEVKSKISFIHACLLQLHMQLGGMRCPNRPSLIEVLEPALQDAYELEDESLQYEIHIRLGQLYNGIRKFDLAAMHYHQLFDIIKHGQLTDYFLPANVYMELNFSLYYAQDYQASIQAGLSGLLALPGDPFPPHDTLNPFQRMLVWNTLGLGYAKMLKSDSAFWAFDKAEQHAQLLQNVFWVGIINGNKGDVYFDLGQYDTAARLLQLDMDRSVAADQFDNAANSLQWLGRIDLKNKKPKVALEKLYKATDYLKIMPQPNYLANVYQAFSEVYTVIGQADSVSVYLGKYLHLRDSVQNEIAKSRTDILEMRLNNQEQLLAIKLLNKQKQQIAITRNFMIALFSLLGCMSYIWYLRQRQKMLNRQQEVLKEKQLAEAEAQNATSQLAIYRQHLLEKNALIEKWQSARDSREESEEFNKRISELSHHLILNEDDWAQFKKLFDSVYPGFFSMLRNKVPDITQAEQRMAALSKLRMSTKEAANLLGVSPNTIHKTRQRLRQRIGLEQDSDLDPYFTEANFQ